MSRISRTLSGPGPWQRRWPRGSSRVAWVAVGVMLLVPVGVGPSATHLPAAAGVTCLVGAGTTDDPFLVGNADDLAKVGSGTDGCTLGASYLQTADIALAAPAAGDSSNVPTASANSAVFTGVFDGGGFTIDGLVIARARENGVGFFHAVVGATIRDVHITGGSITGRGLTGGLIGTAGGSMVSGSSFSGTVTADDRRVGGLIGLSIGSTVLRSFSQGTVTGETFVGGLIGDALTTDVAASFSTADVLGTGGRVGGLIGLFQGPSDGSAAGRHLTDSFARGDVTSSTGVAVGGVIGEVSDATIARVFATGAVSQGCCGVVGLVTASTGSTTIDDSFWDTQTSGQATSPAGTGRTTGQLTSHATFTDTTTEGLTTAWPIVAGWAPYEDGTTVWGLCTGVNGGYPFLLWQFDTDPCSAPAGADSSSLALSCEGTRAAGTKVTCTVTGGDAGIDILWRAAYNPTFAEAGVTLDASGSGEFSFVVPAAALGEVLTVELVEWLAPVSLGVSGGPVPTSVPSGGGPVPVWPFGLLALAGGLVLRHGSRSGRSALRAG